jgi:thiamine-monophosphate kinase
VALVGGDTTRGPLSVCVTVQGWVARDRVLRREGACVGDDVWVSGSLGDAAAALVQWRAGGAADPRLRVRLDRPQPRVDLGLALAGIAHACIDVSDGLLADLGHVCVASGVGARIDVDALPTSPTLAELFNEEARRTLQAAGGDDYELCFCAPSADRDAVLAAAASAAVAVTRIGTIVAGNTVAVVDRGGAPWQAVRAGFAHFSGGD